jgi:hypothetical protein
VLGEVDRSVDVAALVLVVEAAVDDEELLDAFAVPAALQFVELWTKKSQLEKGEETGEAGRTV